MPRRPRPGPALRQSLGPSQSRHPRRSTQVPSSIADCLTMGYGLSAPGEPLEDAMEYKSLDIKKLGPKCRLLSRGESTVISIGLAMAGLFFAAMAGLAWWTLRAQENILQTARVAELREAGGIVGQSAESLLAVNELSAVRRLVAQAGQTYGLSRCRIVLPDQHVLADIDPSAISAKTLPGAWAALPEEPTGESVRDGQYSLRCTVDIPGHGVAVLELVGAVEPKGPTYGMARSGLEGVGVIGAAGSIGLLLVYRHMRSRLRGLGAIREALVAVSAGEVSPKELIISGDFGAEAKAWNEILAQKESLHQQIVAERAQSAGCPAGAGQ